MGSTTSLEKQSYYWKYSDYAKWKNIKNDSEKKKIAKSIRVLDFNNENIDKIDFDNDLIFFENLEILDCSFCVMKLFPESICNLSKLQILNIECNMMEKIPDSIYKLTNLREFYCKYCNIIELPKNISKLKNLKYFDCRANLIKTIPKNIIPFENLENLLHYQRDRGNYMMNSSKEWLYRIDKKISFYTNLE